MITRYLSLNVLGIDIVVQVSDPQIHSLIARAFSAMISSFQGHCRAAFSYEISGSLPDARIHRGGHVVGSAEDEYDLLYGFEKDLTIELQHHRSNLLFVHAAALCRDGRVVLITAPSGTGKSTTAWGLLHQGFDYLSDELAPIDLETMTVHPYPHALCLKTEPPPPYPLPPDVLTTAWTKHVDPESLPGAIVTKPMPVTTVILLSREPGCPEPRIQPVTPAAAAAQIYSNSLNLLAHDNQGLDAVVRVARHSRCYQLTAGDLESTCRLIAGTVASDGEKDR